MPVTEIASMQAMNQHIERLMRKIEDLESVNAVRSLQYKYGYYMDKGYYNETVDLFSETAAIRFLNGIYRGKSGARRLYCDWFRDHFAGGHNGPTYGFLLDHLLLQGVVDIGVDGNTAQGRFRCFMQGGYHESRKERIQGFPDQCWEGGIYENEYVREDGVWKIKLLNYNMLWQANYAEGWAHSAVHLPALTKTFPEDPRGPDELVEAQVVWPHTRSVPFHYNHPITGRPTL
jgi:hypothetical protein